MESPGRAQLRQGWGIDVELSPNFLEWHIDKGLLLHYLAEQARDRIDERTDGGYNVYGARFAPYRPKWVRPCNADGSLKRDAKGRYLPREMVRGPDDVPSLRSWRNIAEENRMRGNLGIFPRLMAPDTKTVTIKIVGGYKGVGHLLRAATVSGLLLGAAQFGKVNYRVSRNVGGRSVKVPGKRGRFDNTGATYYRDKSGASFKNAQALGNYAAAGFAPRPFVGITPAEWSELLTGIKREGVVAFCAKRGQEILDERIRAAISAQDRATKARDAAARRAAAGAKAANQRAVQRAQRLNIEAGETAQEAYRRQQHERRLAKHTRKIKAREARSGR